MNTYVSMETELAPSEPDVQAAAEPGVVQLAAGGCCSKHCSMSFMEPASMADSRSCEGVLLHICIYIYEGFPKLGSPKFGKVPY